MSSKSLFKRKYRYIQAFPCDVSAGPRSYLGFYRIGTEEEHTAFFNDALSSAIFPHYGFSFYDNPPGRIVQKGKGNTPTLFQSNRMMNLGLGSVVKRVDSTDMFTDEALACHRPVSCVMAMGKAGQLATDLSFLRGASGPGHDIWSPLNEWGWIADDSVPDNDTLRANQVMYDEVFHLDTSQQAGYMDFVYLTAGTPVSYVLSHATVQNIIHSQARHLKPLFQIPLDPDADKERLCGIFSMNHRQVRHVEFQRHSYPMLGAFPGIFGFKDALFDVATGLLTGKRNNVVQFLLLLNGLGLLAQRDLRYLV